MRSRSPPKVKTVGAGGVTKLWGGSGLHPLVEKYTVGDDYLVDAAHFIKFDLVASRAHAKMLAKIGVLTAEEGRQLAAGLDEIDGLHSAGKFEISREDEDCHTAIEKHLTATLGDVGKKIHTGRSRNDQSLTMIRLFAKHHVQEILRQTEQLAAVFRAAAEKYKEVPLPGYTHMQKAMPAKVGTWLGAYADAFLASAETQVKPLLGEQMLDQNPLGSAAGFGVNHLVLDRDLTTGEMGLGRTQENVMYCGFSRGWFESMVLGGLSSGVMTVCSRFAVDMMNYTQGEFDFFALPKEFTTGSSIMPQKQNYDVFEIMRGQCKSFRASASSVQDIVSSLGSGYHRDFQLTKKLFAEGICLCAETLALLAEIVPVLVVREEKLKKAMEARELWATDLVYKEVANGMAFRDAYLMIKEKYMKGDV